MKKVAFYTLGCKVNQYEKNGMIQEFLKKGYEVVDFDKKADIYIILMAGLVHAGPLASVETAAMVGLRCAKITVECPDTVNKHRSIPTARAGSRGGRSSDKSARLVFLEPAVWPTRTGRRCRR